MADSLTKRLKKLINNMDNKLLKDIAYKCAYLHRKLRYFKTCWLHPVSEKLVVFESFKGRSYSDSPRALYEAMLSDPAYDSFNFIWIIRHDKYREYFPQNDRTTLVVKNTHSYYKAYAKAKYWVNNTGIAGIADELRPRIGQSYIETWHGTPLKKICCDINDYPGADLSILRKRYHTLSKKITYMPSPSDFYHEKVSSAFGLHRLGKENVFINTGLPRNTRLYSSQEEDTTRIKLELNIPLDKKVILYAPTWRNTEYVEALGFVYYKSFDIPEFLKQIGEEYIILFRLHYLQKIDPQELTHERIFDVSSVADINDLYLISDMMITDYSSTMFDYAILKRPMLFYMYDRESYVNEQTGIYFDLEELPGPIVQEESDLAKEVLKLFNNFSYNEKYETFNAKFNQYGDAHSARNFVNQCMPANGDDNPTFPQRMRANTFLKCIYLPFHAANKVFKKLYRLGIIVLKEIYRWYKKIFRYFYYNITGFFKSFGLCLSQNSKQLYAFKNKYQGKRCFIIGNGPSLTVSDLELLKDEYTFGCNMLFKLFSETDWRPSFYCITDANYVLDELAENVEEQMFTIRLTYKKMKRRMKQTPKKLIYVNNISSRRYYKMRGNAMAYCIIKATVLTLMIEIATFMGFEELYLIGVDCTNPFTSNGHFKNYGEEKIIQKDVQSIYKKLKSKDKSVDTAGQFAVDKSIYVYKKIKRFMDRKKTFTIYNATRGGALEVFERRDLDEVLKKQG